MATLPSSRPVMSPSHDRLDGPTAHMAKNCEPAAVGVAERHPGAVDLVLAGLAPHLHGGLGEADHARGADGVGRQHAARRVPGDVAVHGRWPRPRPASSPCPPRRSRGSPATSARTRRTARRPRPRRCRAGVGDAGLGVDVGGAVPAALGRHLVAPGAIVGSDRMAPPSIHAGSGGGVAARLVGQHHGAGAVGGRAGLRVADRVPQHHRVLDRLERDVLLVEVGLGVLQGVLPVLQRHQDADVVGRARAAHVGPDVGAK